MNYIGISDEERDEMLTSMGLSSLSDLLTAIPKDLLLKAPKSDDGLSEYEGISLVEALGKENTFNAFDAYLGGGAYDHYVPAIVASICQKSEFLTPYTPYQAEATQGVLQALFEYQSAVCALTGMDLSNASVYDGASGCAEASLMALRAKRGRNKIALSENLHPHYRAVVEQYLTPRGFETVGLDQIDESVAGVLVQSPNFFGGIEPVQEIFDKAHAVGALAILSANPLAYGLFPSAAELGADIACGEMQPFGIPLQFGGPYSGYLACRTPLMRQMAGRLIGKTVDTEGTEGYVITLQAREQHIRREKANSNVCTGQALCAIASLVAILWHGPKGIKELALTNYQRAGYVKQALAKKYKVSEETTFNEFVVHLDRPAKEVINACMKKGVIPGLDLGRWFPERKNDLLIAVTEKKSQDQLDKLVEVLT